MKYKIFGILSEKGKRLEHGRKKKILVKVEPDPELHQWFHIMLFYGEGKEDYLFKICHSKREYIKTMKKIKKGLNLSVNLEGSG